MTEDCMSPERLAHAVSAAVIPFPSRSAPTSDAREAAAANARLERALQALNSALGEQGEAVAAWRHTLDDLSEAMHGLGTSMLRYRDGVDALDTEIALLGVQATELAARADAMAASTPPPGQRPAPWHVVGR